MKDLTNKIVYNKLSDGTRIHYIVKASDGLTLRVEQLKTQPKDNIEDSISLEELRNNDKRLGIVYYGYGKNKKLEKRD